MSFQEQAKKAAEPGFIPAGRMCGVKRLRFQLSDQPAELAALDNMLTAKSDDKFVWPHTVLREIMKHEGHNLSLAIIEKHRAGICACL